MSGKSFSNCIDKEERWFFASFADSSLKPSLDRIKRQAKEFGCFRRIWLYNEKNLPKYAKKRVEEVIRITGTKRGFAYWSWKPAVILDCLKKMKNGDVLFYTDVGTHLNARGIGKFNEFVERAKKHDIWVTKLDACLNELNYTKMDTIHLFENRIPNRDVLLEGQIQSGIVILVKNSYTVGLINSWDELMELKNVHYFDDTPSILVNDPSFVENRHDQSLFSLLLKSNHYYAEAECYCYAETEEGWNKLALTEPILARRDKQKAKPKVSLFKKLKKLVKKLVKKFEIE